jgi:creatinine deaminase
VDCLDDPACEALMQKMLQGKPELWAEDIGQ